MAQIDDLSNALAALQGVVDDAIHRVSNLPVPTPAPDLAPMIAQVESISQAVANIAPVPDPPQAP